MQLHTFPYKLRVHLPQHLNFIRALRKLSKVVVTNFSLKVIQTQSHCVYEKLNQMMRENTKFPLQIFMVRIVQKHNCSYLIRVVWTSVLCWKRENMQNGMRIRKTQIGVISRKRKNQWPHLRKSKGYVSSQFIFNFLLFFFFFLRRNPSLFTHFFDGFLKLFFLVKLFVLLFVSTTLLISVFFRSYWADEYYWLLWIDWWRRYSILWNNL